MSTSNGPPNTPLDLAAALGANTEYATQCFSIYVPNKDRTGAEFGNQRKWVLEAIHLLSELNGGATAMPPVEGAWVNDEAQMIWEHPVVVYSYMRSDSFFANLTRIREFLHRLGRETNQGEVAVEFEGRFYLIRDYDPAGSGEQP